jgi:hypothetical protein
MVKKPKKGSKKLQVKDLDAKKNPKGGAFDAYLKIADSGVVRPTK